MKIIEIKLKTDEKFKNRTAEKLRGYMGNHFKNIIEFHNHIDEITFNYETPSIQYRVVDGQLNILGINKGADILLDTMGEIETIKLDGKSISVDLEIKVSFPKLEIVEDTRYKYKFETLWFALNSKNYRKFLAGELDLNSQLRNNIIEFFKLSNIWADKKIEVIGNFKEGKIIQKDTIIKGFYGEFETNVDLPDNISLGKRKSVGFGRIKKI